MDATRNMGYLSAVGLALVGLVYLIVVAVGIASVGLEDPIVDPTLAVMEVLTLLSAPLIVAVLASVLVQAPRQRRVFAILALCFGTIMAGLTSAVHFVALTAGRQTDFTVLAWPSTLYAVELLAWDWFLGLALVFAAFVFTGPGIRAAVRWALVITGALCLLGVIGPLVGDMALQRIGIVGYGVGLPITSVILARYFGRNGTAPRDDRAT